MMRPNRRLVAVAIPLLVLGWSSTLSAQFCQGDCTVDAAVTVDELVTIVGIALGDQSADVCISSDASCDGRVTVDEILGSVDRALNGCSDTYAPRGELLYPASPAQGLLSEHPEGTMIGGTPRMPAQYVVVGTPEEIDVEVIASRLEVPWALAFAPDGRLFVTERTGRVRVVVNGELDEEPWATIGVSTTTSEGGLLGLAIHPNFPEEPWVYVCYTVPGRGVTNRISRLPEVSGRGGEEEILVDDVRGAVIHDGCRLKFGPDGMLYATTGDAGQRALAQSLTSLEGKVLRIRPDGGVPADNPFGPDLYVYSYGHRNPQGLAFRRRDGALFETEHGPSGEIAGLLAHDEVNRIEAGINYGWPQAVGAPQIAEYRDPILLFPITAVPPAGASFYESDVIPKWNGNFFFTSLGARHLQRVILDPCDRVGAIEWLFAGPYGRLRDVVEGPDGYLYFTTSNRDGRGLPGIDDDRILRIVPRG